MSLSAKQSPDIAEKVKTILLMAEKYNECLRNIDEKEGNFLISPDLSLHDILYKEKMDAKNFSENCLTNISRLINDIDSILKNLGVHTQTEATDTIPTMSEIEKMTNSFYREQIKTKTAPYPKNCGCYASRTKEIRPNTFVCAKLETGNYLMLVHHADNEVVYGFIIAEQMAKITTVPISKIEILPSSIPEKPQTRWEHSKQIKVLSLIPEGDSWSNVFYEAFVVKRPYDRINEEVRGYELNFVTGETAIVPEQYIVQYSEKK